MGHLAPSSFLSPALGRTSAAWCGSGFQHGPQPFVERSFEREAITDDVYWSAPRVGLAVVREQLAREFDRVAHGHAEPKVQLAGQCEEEQGGVGDAPSHTSARRLDFW